MDTGLAPAWLELLRAPRPIWVGERLNPDGSDAVRRAMKAGDYARLVGTARQQVAAGARALDVRVGRVGGDPSAELARLCDLLDRLADVLDVVFFADSADPDVLTGAARHRAGRVALNSVSLAAGPDPVVAAAAAAREVAAPLVVLLLDDRGPEVRAADRLAIAQRIWSLLIEEEGAPPEGLLFDPVTLPFGKPVSGGRLRRDAAVEALETLRLLKAEWPQAQTITSVSNLTHGLEPQARSALNALYLLSAGREGLDFAILNPEEIRSASEAVDALWPFAQYALFDGRERALEEYVEAARARLSTT